MDRGAFGLCSKPNAYAERRPAGWRRIEMFKLRQRLVSLGGERVDAQIERRAAGERSAFRRTLIAERALQMRIEPFRIVAFDVSRRTGGRAGNERRGFYLRERRRRVAAAIA